jgi:acyl-CoA thioesterase
MTTAPPRPEETSPGECIRVFNDSEFALLLGMAITEARDGYARVTMDCAGKANPGGVAHGGAIFSIADQAFGIAANCAGVHRVAVSVSILYLVPATGTLVAIAERVQDNGTTDTYRVMVYAGDRPVAEFTGVAFRV